MVSFSLSLSHSGSRSFFIFFFAPLAALCKSLTAGVSSHYQIIGKGFCFTSNGCLPSPHWHCSPTDRLWCLLFLSEFRGHWLSEIKTCYCLVWERYQTYDIYKKYKKEKQQWRKHAILNIIAMVVRFFLARGPLNGLRHLPFKPTRTARNADDC